MDMNKFGALIAEKRKALGLTQAELGRLVDVTDKAVSKWERGVSLPDIAIINRLAVELRVNLNEILADRIGDIAQSSNIHRSETVPGLEQKLCAPVCVRPGQQGAFVSPRLFGCNLEHTRSDIFMGLSAQMLRNRKFAGKPSVISGHAVEWYAIGEKAFFQLIESETYTRHHALYHMHRKHECNSQRIVNMHPGVEIGIGQHEMSVRAGRTYDVRVAVRTSAPVTLQVALTARHGKTVYAASTLKVDGEEWQTCEASLTPQVTDPDADLRITFTEKASVVIGAVSLLPADAYLGMRRDVIECMKACGISVLRWPGGNFAGEYNWLDGLLPVDMRAPLQAEDGIETQPHSLGYDFHEIDTDTFVALCREVGAEPYITLNPTWNTSDENAAWVEYCNGSEDTPYGRLRAERGHPEPYNVCLWSLGNEFGYGHMEGDNSPTGYCRIARENAQKMLAVSPDLTLCSSGPYPNEQWLQQSAMPLKDMVKLLSQHYYSHEPVYPDTDSLAEEYYATLSGTEWLCDALAKNRASLPEDISISMDEWNVWYAWYRPASVIDGIFNARTFHMFMTQAEKVGIGIACHFEAVNEGIICVTPETAYLTPQGDSFAAMKHHAGGHICFAGQEALMTRRNGRLTATVVNGSFDGEKPVTFSGCGKLICAKLYTGDVITPPSAFSEADAQLTPADGGYAIILPPHSLLLAQFEE